MQKQEEMQQRRAPTFEEAQNRRQKVRAAGMNPNYWYAVEYDKALKPGKAVEVKFWNDSVALFRGEDGAIGAIANRCVHRQLPLSAGEVKGCNLVCPYHGWTYDTKGEVVDIPHELFSATMPKFKVPSYPVRVRYGLIWIFFGDPARAGEVDIPAIPELDQADPWPHLHVDFTVNAHHSMIIDNVSDFTHEYLHRKFKPFADAKMTGLEVRGDEVHVSYDTQVGGGNFYRHFVDHKNFNTKNIDLCYQYPYQRSSTGGRIKHWLFVLPMDERTTRTFYLFYLDIARIPGIPFKLPNWVMKPVTEIARRALFKPLLNEDAWAVEMEQRGYERHFDLPIAELNPAVREFQKITIRKWEEHLAEVAERAAARAKRRSHARPAGQSPRAKA